MRVVSSEVAVQARMLFVLSNLFFLFYFVLFLRRAGVSGCMLF